MSELIGPRKVDLVLMSIGGNDAGFANVIAAYLAREPIDNWPDIGPNWKEIESAINTGNWTGSSYEDVGSVFLEMFDWFSNFDWQNRQGLDGMESGYDEVNEKLKEYDIDSTSVFILQYPDGFVTNPAKSDPVCPGPVLTDVADILGRDLEVGRQEQNHARNYFIKPLNREIERAAQSAGWHVINAEDVMYGHAICENDRYLMLHKKSLEIQWNAQGMMHPNKKGYEAIARRAFETVFVTWSPERSPTPTPAPPTPTAIPTPTAVPTPVNGENHTFLLPGGREVEMVYIPAGSFTIDIEGNNIVTLDDYWIDRTEVTNAQYAACVADGSCQPPRNEGSYTRDSYYGNPIYDNYPVIWVTWYDAATFCAWRDASLPTYDEWNKAAAWNDDNQNVQNYYWGDAFDGIRLNFCDAQCPIINVKNNTVDDGHADTAPVGSYPAGASYYGVLDMGGNVWEWTENLHNADSSERSVRGGSWNNDPTVINVQHHHKNLPYESYNGLGFRCVYHPPFEPDSE